MAIREGTIRNDRLLGTRFADTLEGKAGHDVLFGFDGHDTMDGDSGNDYLSGGGGNDTMEGGLGRDTLYGGAGNDILSGDEGNDFMSGGTGDDRFIFDSGDGDDTIVGFSVGGTVDEIDLRDAAADFTSFQNVLARAHNTALGVLIDLGGEDSVLLVGVREAQLKASDFVL